MPLLLTSPMPLHTVHTLKVRIHDLKRLKAKPTQRLSPASGFPGTDTGVLFRCAPPVLPRHRHVHAPHWPTGPRPADLLSFLLLVFSTYDLLISGISSGKGKAKKDKKDKKGKAASSASPSSVAEAVARARAIAASASSSVHTSVDGMVPVSGMDEEEEEECDEFGEGGRLPGEPPSPSTNLLMLPHCLTAPPACLPAALLFRYWDKAAADR